MNVQDLKNKCNETYSKAIKLMENNGDVSSICRSLLEVAELLVELGKVDSTQKTVCEQKAQKLLNVAKSLRVSKDIASAYKTLTGRELQQSKEPENKIPQNKEPDVAELIKQGKAPAPKQSTPLEFTFDWDHLPSISFDDVAGLEDVKDAVRKKVLLPLSNPQLYEGYVKKNGGGLLLYGPPGTGKTMIAAAIAKEIGAKFCSIGAADLVLGGIGNSEKAISKLFEEARSFKCSVIFFDEIESICPVTTHAQHARQIRSELLRQMQGMEAYGKDDGHILFLIAATNKPWEIDPAFVRPGRFGTRIYVGLPDAPARKYMVEQRLGKIRQAGKVQIGEIDIENVVNQTENFNGADMTNLLDEVQEISIMRSASTHVKEIINDDFVQALKKVKSSVQPKDLQRLKDWMRENNQ